MQTTTVSPQDARPAPGRPAGVRPGRSRRARRRAVSGWAYALPTAAVVALLFLTPLSTSILHRSPLPGVLIPHVP